MTIKTLNEFHLVWIIVYHRSGDLFVAGFLTNKECPGNTPFHVATALHEGTKGKLLISF